MSQHQAVEPRSSVAWRDYYALLYPLTVETRAFLVSRNPIHARRKRAEMQPFLAFYRQLVREGDLCFDVGAHMGQRTEVFRSLGATVIAIEPQQKCVDVLRRKFRSDEKVILIPKGLDEATGERQMFASNRSTCSTMSTKWMEAVRNWERMRRIAADWQPSTTVPVTTMDKLIARYGMPQFCKIDVEGFEIHVLKGLSRAVPSLSFEYNPRYTQAAMKCVERLAELGLYKFNYSEGDSMEWALPAWVDREAIEAEIRATLPHKDVYGDIYAKLTG